MTDQLLPPDPSKGAWYWIKQPYTTKAILWDAELRSWQTDREIIQDWDAHRRGWTLASPHPIPTPEQLDALHALSAAMRKEAVTNWSARSQHDHVAAAVGQAAVCAAMLRAALGAKP